MLSRTNKGSIPTRRKSQLASSLRELSSNHPILKALAASVYELGWAMSGEQALREGF